MKIHNPFRTALVATLGVGLGIVLISSVDALSSILLYVGTALFLALGLDPLVSRIERRGVRRWLAVLITILAVLAVLTGIVLIVLPVLIDQISQLVDQTTRLIDRGTGAQDLQLWLSEVFPRLRVDVVFDTVEAWLSQNVTEIGGSIGQGILTVGFAVLGGLAGAFIVLILTIYFTSAIPSLKVAVYQLVPASKRARFIDLAEQITASVGYYVIGQLTMGVINGIASSIVLSIMGAPFPAVLAVIAFFFSLIPLVGTLTGSTLIVLICLLPGLGTPEVALYAAIYYLAYMQIEAYAISPRVMSRAVSVPGAVVVISALAGGALLGLLGALIAIPVAASVLIIYRQVVIPRMNQL